MTLEERAGAPSTVMSCMVCTKGAIGRTFPGIYEGSEWHLLRKWGFTLTFCWNCKARRGQRHLQLSDDTLSPTPSLRAPQLATIQINKHLQNTYGCQLSAECQAVE
jgi:hypothetical protein